MANMMKKILILFLMIFVSGTSYAADFSDFVRKWVKDSGEGIAWCGCTCESNLDNGSVCIGTDAIPLK